MKIETKYDLHEEVWYIKNNKVSSTYIYDIEITITNKGEIIPRYGLNSIGSFKTDELFKTKEELLASL